MSSESERNRGRVNEVNDKVASTVVLNVGGTRFETFTRTLQQSDCKRLQSLNKTSPNYRRETNDFFFDRDPATFREVLNYFRSGELHVPFEQCGMRVKNELEFWGLDECLLQGCCGPQYHGFATNEKVNKKLKQDFTDTDVFDREKCFGRVSSVMWSLLEKPSSSKFAMVYCLWMSLISATLVIILILSTMPQLVTVTYFYENGTQANVTTLLDGINRLDIVPPGLALPELGCVAMLTLDFLLRFIFCPKALLFIKSPWNIIDFCSIFPYFLSILITGTSLADRWELNIIILVKIGKVFQFLRILRVVKHYQGFTFVVYTLKMSVTEIAMFVVNLVVGVLLFGALIHFAEPQNFPSIPISCWWAIVTMTTVGYGDMYPTTTYGYIVASVCASVGLLIVAFTVPILVNNFVLFYTHMEQIKSETRIHRKKVSWHNGDISVNDCTKL